MIDCDVHQSLSSIQDLFPYLPRAFREQIERGGHPGFPQYPYTHPEGFWRGDSFPADGSPPGADYELLRDQLLDAYGIDYGMLTGEDILTVSGMADPRLAAALARAYNDWLAETWLPLDRRLKGSIAVAAQDPAGAAAEVRRAAANADMVQVLLPSGAPAGYGHPRYWPLWEAAEETGLVVGIHAGGAGCGVNGQPTATGWPTYYIEYHTLGNIRMMSHLVSFVCHGVFERFPALRVCLIEGGVAWLPGLLWRLDQGWKALRSEVPELGRLPSEYVRAHVRLTTQPLERPASTRDLTSLLELIGRETLLFATDYPYWDFDNPLRLALPEGWEEAVLDANARAWYGLPARKEVKKAPTAPAAG